MMRSLVLLSILSACSSSASGPGRLRFAVADPVTLPRFKSALLTVFREPVEARALSVYNPTIHPTHPLKGFHLKNTTKQFLAQGPLTVYDGGTAVGRSSCAGSESSVTPVSFRARQGASPAALLESRSSRASDPRAPTAATRNPSPWAGPMPGVVICRSASHTISGVPTTAGHLVAEGGDRAGAQSRAGAEVKHPDRSVGLADWRTTLRST